MPSITIPSQSFVSNVGINDPPQPYSGEDMTVAPVTTDPLVTLKGDIYDRDKFALINDLEFTELVSSIEGIGVDEFFVLYEELKDKIDGGTVNFDLMVEYTEPDSVLTLANSIAASLKEALLLGQSGSVAFSDLLASIRARYQTLIDKVSKIQDLFKDADPKTHAYLVANSLPKVTQIQQKFTAIFELLVTLLDRNADLTQQINELVAENESLKQQVKQLNDLVLLLTAPEPTGFQVYPNLFTTITMGNTWQPGSHAQIMVCGSANYYFGAPEEGASPQDTTYTSPDGIRFESVNGTSMWSVFTPNDQSLLGKTVFVTVNSGVVSKVPESEQLVFVFPGSPIVPFFGLKSSVGNTITLYIPTNGPNGEPYDINAFNDRYITSTNVIISGGSTLYTHKNYSIPAPGPNTPHTATGYFNVDSARNGYPTSDSYELSLTALREGSTPNVLVITDGRGYSIPITVIVQKVYVPKDASTITPVTIDPQHSQIEFVGGSTTLTVRGGSLPRKLSWISGDGSKFRVSRTTSGDAELVTFISKESGFYHGQFSGGPPTQPYTEFWITVNQ